MRRPGSTLIAEDGYQYGVRFMDGSVAARWSGRTQRQRAEEYLAKIRKDYPESEDRYAVVRRKPGEPLGGSVTADPVLCPECGEEVPDDLTCWLWNEKFYCSETHAAAASRRR